ncbi:Multidrug resistance protein MexB [Trichinella spiralis]|uniref:Multidrug resistance protein MexB n=1 Tax=Trichinella spiralis TaxID=6334 RepID=A0ABR3KEF5_TRISP
MSEDYSSSWRKYHLRYMKRLSYSPVTQQYALTTLAVFLIVLAFYQTIIIHFSLKAVLLATHPPQHLQQSNYGDESRAHFQATTPKRMSDQSKLKFQKRRIKNIIMPKITEWIY